MVKGSCLCKAYRFEVEGPFSYMMHCHCSMCRKAHGAAFATFVGCKSKAFKVIQGHDAVTRYQSSEKGIRCFCKVCGSNLPSQAGEEVWLPAGMLDDDPGIRPAAHYFVGSKAPWTDITDELPQSETYPSG